MLVPLQFPKGWIKYYIRSGTSAPSKCTVYCSPRLAGSGLTAHWDGHSYWRLTCRHWTPLDRSERAHRLWERVRIRWSLFVTFVDCLACAGGTSDHRPQAVGALLIGLLKRKITLFKLNWHSSSITISSGINYWSLSHHNICRNELPIFRAAYHDT